MKTFSLLVLAMVLVMSPLSQQAAVRTRRDNHGNNPMGGGEENGEDMGHDDMSSTEQLVEGLKALLRETEEDDDDHSSMEGSDSKGHEDSMTYLLHLLQLAVEHGDGGMGGGMGDGDGYQEMWKWNPLHPCEITFPNGTMLYHSDCPGHHQCNMEPMDDSGAIPPTKINDELQNMRVKWCALPTPYFLYHACEVIDTTSEENPEVKVSEECLPGYGSCSYGPFKLTMNGHKLSASFCDQMVQKWDQEKTFLDRACRVVEKQDNGHIDIWAQRHCPYGYKCDSDQMDGEMEGKHVTATFCVPGKKADDDDMEPTAMPPVEIPENITLSDLLGTIIFHMVDRLAGGSLEVGREEAALIHHLLERIMGMDEDVELSEGENYLFEVMGRLLYVHKHGHEVHMHVVSLMHELAEEKARSHMLMNMLMQISQRANKAHKEAAENINQLVMHVLHYMIQGRQDSGEGRRGGRGGDSSEEAGSMEGMMRRMMHMMGGHSGGSSSHHEDDDSEEAGSMEGMMRRMMRMMGEHNSGSSSGSHEEDDDDHDHEAGILKLLGYVSQMHDGGDDDMMMSMMNMLEMAMDQDNEGMVHEIMGRMMERHDSMQIMHMLMSRAEEASGERKEHWMKLVYWLMEHMGEGQGRGRESESESEEDEDDGGCEQLMQKLVAMYTLGEAVHGNLEPEYQPMMEVLGNAIKGMKEDLQEKHDGEGHDGEGHDAMMQMMMNMVEEGNMGHDDMMQMMQMMRQGGGSRQEDDDHEMDCPRGIIQVFHNVLEAMLKQSGYDKNIQLLSDFVKHHATPGGHPEHGNLFDLMNHASLFAHENRPKENDGKLGDNALLNFLMHHAMEKMYD